jgi:hypothetical protein
MTDPPYGPPCTPAEGREPQTVPALPPSTAAFAAVLDEILSLHNRKGADYGSGSDPFANVRVAEEYGLPAWVGVQIRLDDKRSRIQKAVGQLLKGEPITMSNESLRDSLLDRCVYSVIALVLYDEADTRKPT